MFYINLRADRGDAIESARVKLRFTADVVFDELARQAMDMSKNCDKKFSVCMYTEYGDILAESVYADGKQIP